MTSAPIIFGSRSVRSTTSTSRWTDLPTIRLLEDEAAPILWGITYKFRDDFMATIGRPIPFMPWERDDVG